MRQTLAFVGKSAPGSLIVFTYVLRSIIEGTSGIPGADKMTERMKKNNSSWTFGLDPVQVASFLRPYHLDLTADAGRVDYQRMYLRPLRRDLVISDIERVVQARVNFENHGHPAAGISFSPHHCSDSSHSRRAFCSS